MAMAEYAQQVASERGVANNGAVTTSGVPYKPVEPASALGSVAVPEYDARKVADTLRKQVDFSGDYINKATDTVAGQLEGLLASHSPYIKQARNRALETAQARGWGGSTMMQEAGELAAIKSALPIAQQDAQTWAQSALRTQDAQQNLEGQKGQGIIEGALKEQDQTFQGMENYLQRQHEGALKERDYSFQGMQNRLQRQHEGALKEQDYAFQGRENQLQRQHESGILKNKQAFESQQNKYNRQHQTALQNDIQAFESQQNAYIRAHQMAVQNDNQAHVLKLEGIQNRNKVALERINNEHQRLMTEMELDATQQRSMSQGMSQIMNDYLTSVESVMTDPSFLELSGLDLEKTVNNLQTFAMNQMSFLGSIYQEDDIDKWIDAAFPPVTKFGR